MFIPLQSKHQDKMALLSLCWGRKLKMVLGISLEVCDANSVSADEVRASEHFVWKLTKTRICFSIFLHATCALELDEHADRPLIPAFKWLKRNKAPPDVGLEQPVGHIGSHPDSATGDWNWSLPGTKCEYVFFFFLKFLNLFNFCVDRDIRQLFENLSLFPELRTRSLYVKPQECQWEPFGVRISCKRRARLEAVTLT